MRSVYDREMSPQLGREDVSPAVGAAGRSESRTARARLSAQAGLARIVRSAWRRTRSIPRTRSGGSAHPFFSRPNSRSTAARPR